GGVVTAPAGTYTVTATLGTCTSVASNSITIDAQPVTPSAPIAVVTTQPSCTTATGSFTITNYDASYTYTITPSTGVTTIGGVVTAPAGTYTVTATLGTCTSVISNTVVINASIPDSVQKFTYDTQCALDNALEINIMTIINTQFGPQPTGGTWTDVNSSGALDVTTGIFVPFNLANGSYIVRYVTNDANCPKTFEITIPTSKDYPTCSVEACKLPKVYNAVTPNGDNKNDYFEIENITNLDCYPENTVEIYNRWGVKVYDTENYNNDTRAFRGVSEGRDTVKESAELPTGTYFYILKYKSIDGIYTTKNGYLYLSR
ncbi:MAG: gliding motility-associated C-terminal domain-containing protein, partial [Flavobacterium sp.]